MSTLARALEIAHEAHAGQVDKAGRPYIEHVLRVVDAVDGEDAKVLAALHDVVEDCPGWNFRRILDAGFDGGVIAGLSFLTRARDGSYALYLSYISWQGGNVLAVKLADLRDNADPARLALLPEKDRVKLSKKYAAALAALGAPPSDATPAGQS